MKTIKGTSAGFLKSYSVRRVCKYNIPIQDKISRNSSSKASIDIWSSESKKNKYWVIEFVQIGQVSGSWIETGDSF